MIMGRVLFYGYDRYKTPLHVFGTLVNALFGSVDFSIYETGDTIDRHMVFGYTYIVSFIIICSITLLNFLIAIISHVYDSLSTRSVGLYLKYIILARQVQQNDDKHSWLVSCSPPINAIIFPFTPLILCLRNKTVNN